MEPRSSLADVLTGDGTAVGTYVQSVSKTVVEALGYTPLDFLFVDHQHGPPVDETLADLVRAADLRDLPMVVRVPRDDASAVTRMLDSGVRGIMLPQVEDAATVAEMSSHVRYRDGRSLGSSTRAARFGNVPKAEYADYVNEELALLPMVETAAGVEAAGDVAAAEGTTALAVGPGDLAWSLDVPFGSDAHRAAVDRTFDAAAEHDCPVGIFVGTEENLRRYAGRAAFVVYRTDVSILTSHYEDALGDVV